MGMGITPIGSFQPYIYNVNAVGSGSMNKVNGISDDALSGKVDYTGLATENQNPLPMGKSKNFADIIMQQMSMSEMNAQRIIQDPEEDFSNILDVITDIAADQVSEDIVNKNAQEPSLFRRMSASQAYEANFV